MLQRIEEAKKEAASTVQGKQHVLELANNRVMDAQTALDKAAQESEHAKTAKYKAEEELRQAQELASQKDSEASALFAKAWADAQKMLSTLSAWKEKI